MGDTPLTRGVPAEFSQQDTPAGAFQTPQTTVSGRVPAEHLPTLTPAQPQQQTGTPQHAFSSQLDMTQQHVPSRGHPFDLSAMVSALPAQPGYRTGSFGQGQPRYNAIAVASPVSPYGTQAAMPPVPGQQYYLAQHTHLTHFYPTPLAPHQAQRGLTSRPDMGYYQNAAPQYYYPQPAHFPGPVPSQPPPPAQLVLGQYAAPSPQHVDSRHIIPTTQVAGESSGISALVDHGKSPAETRTSVVRGPPRKPRQSGHAIWIGNLPPQTDLMSLVHHVCKETDGLESLFLISKSNCAFANFRDEQASIAAQRKLHDSKFHTVRLVSRLRKSTVEGPAGITAPTGPSSSTSHAEVPSGSVASEADATIGVGAKDDTATAAPAPAELGTFSPLTDGGLGLKDRFFILKSLTIEDIELSVQTGIWATQSHNEETLNGAFRSADNVYLIFSANKSGEYFGYARMVSPINDDPEAAIQFAPAAQPTSDVDLPKAIPTEPTEFAPKGRIIDDSARGTIFWEAERGDLGANGSMGDEEGSGGGSVSGGETGSVKSGQDGPSGGKETKAWGKPFRLEWLSTARLPFYRTRGLRNPWNSNREVKIARDGTELEPSVGRRLIGLFNRAQSPAVGIQVLPGIGSAVIAGAHRGPIPVPVPVGSPFLPPHQPYQP